MRNKYLFLLLANFIGLAVSAQIQSPIAEIIIKPTTAVCSINGQTDLKAEFTDIRIPTDYTAEKLPNYFFFPYAGGTQIQVPPPPNDDDFWSPGVFSMPFKFCFYGNTYDKLMIGSNGCLTFDIDGSNGTMTGGRCEYAVSQPFPSASFPTTGYPIRNAIFGVFQDIHFAGRNPTISDVNYYILNTGIYAAPNRVFILNYNQIPQYPAGSSAAAGLQTYQIVLHETTNVVEVNVQHRKGYGGWQPTAALIGINNATGVRGVSLPGRNLSNFTIDNESYRFTPNVPAPVAPAPGAPTVRWEYLDATNTLVTSTANPIRAIAFRPTTLYTAYVTYTKCDGTQVTIKKEYNLEVGKLPAIKNPVDVCSAPVATSGPVTTADISQVGNMIDPTDNPAGYVFTYYDTQAHANNGFLTGLITDPVHYPVTSLPQQLWVRVEDALGAGCQDVRPFNLKLQPEGQFEYAVDYCKEDTTLHLKQDVAGQPTLSMGGKFQIYDATNAEITNGLIDPTTGAIKPSLGLPGTYTVKYHLDSVGNCSVLDRTATVVIKTCVCDVVSSTDPAGTTNFTTVVNASVCQNTALSSQIELYSSVDNAADGQIITGTLPDGITGIFNATTHRFVISGTPTATATTQTVTVKIIKADLTFCTRDVKIEISTKPNAGDDNTEDICVGSTTAIDLFAQIVPATGTLDIGGTWTRTDAGTIGGTLNTTATTAAFDPTGATAGTATFKYEVTKASCTSDSSTVTINVKATLNAGTDDSKDACSNDTTVIDLATIIGTHDTGGSWTKTSVLPLPPGAFNATTGEFIANGAQVGAHKFKYTIAATSTCAAVSSEATVNVLSIPTATIAFAGTASPPLLTKAVCKDDAVKIRFNVTNAPSPLASTYTFSYTYTGNTTPINVTTASGDTFVEVNAATTTAGNFTYTLLGVKDNTTAACANATFANDHVDLKVNALPVAVISTSAASVCMGTAAAAAPKIKFEATSGTAPFKFTYTFTGNTTPITVSSTTATYEITVPTTAAAATYTIDYDLLSVEDSALGSGTAGCKNTTATPQRVSVDVKELPKATISGTKTICYGDVKPGILFSGSSGTAPFTFSYKKNGIVQSPDLTTDPGTNSVSIEADNTASATYEITGVRDASTVSCSSVISGQIATITVNAQPVITSLTITNPSICVNEKTAIKVLPDTGGYHYEWTVPSGVVAPGDVATFDINTSGTYSVVISDANGCKSTSQSASLLVNILPVIEIADGHICTDAAGVPLPGEIYRIESGFPATGYTFKWYAPSGSLITNPGGSTYNANYYDAAELGVYKLEVINTTTPTLCGNTGTATILPSLPPVSATYQVSNYFSETQLITIDVLPAGDYLYQLDNGVFQTSNRFFNLESGEYTVYVKDKFGCGVIPVGPIRIIEFPKFFTPNNDGYNDSWNIPDLKDQLDSKIYIFNRFGKLIKEMSPAGAGWDGNYNGTAMPAEDYWFKIFFTEQGVKKEFKSHFSLKR